MIFTIQKEDIKCAISDEIIAKTDEGARYTLLNYFDIDTVGPAYLAPLSKYLENYPAIKAIRLTIQDNWKEVDSQNIKIRLEVLLDDRWNSLIDRLEE